MLTATGDLADSLVESDGSGNITANVTGNLTGNVTGDVTGDLTGNVIATTIAASSSITKNSVPVYGMVILDTPELLLNTSSPATSATAINSATLNTATASKAIIQITNKISGASGTTGSVFIGSSSSVAATNVYRKSTVTTSVTDYDSCEVTVNLDGNYDFWYITTLAGSSTHTVDIYLVGYYE